MNIVDKYDGIIGVVALFSALGMMIGTAIGVLGAGIWLFKKAVMLKKDKP